MTEIELLVESLPYLRTLLNLNKCRVEPCMSLEDEQLLERLIDEIWTITKIDQESDF